MRKEISGKAFKALIGSFIGLCMIIGLAACAAVVAGGVVGAGGVIYEKGELTQTVNGSVPKVHKATVAALKEMKLPVLEDRYDHLTARMKSKLATGEDVKISLDSVSASTTKVGIRVGIVGDKDKSQAILDKIKSEIKK